VRRGGGGGATGVGSGVVWGTAITEHVGLAGKNS
jgi:hypothetical protein